MNNVETTDIATLPRERVVIAISSLKQKAANLRYTYEKEHQKRQRLHEKLAAVMGETEIFTFDSRDFTRGYPFVTKTERARAIAVIEDVVRTIGNSEYNSKRKKCASLNAEYQTCKKFCAGLKDAIKDMESSIQVLKERLVELDKK